ncbi:MAG: AAA family ATPase [Candidatus Andersenbacteria bacterium CG10_big_fil_rev_8_21_14_0_10_54_11]|uniref:AAA family ATPase n=1 Tax=Candidatus Andersenbacteria bacterium CG10_big_fil_rev_8_21_14_0_10_54_11 TaxID=1974485 RepID=A0A2M6WZX8_9BACT|nr:MAG: AAA family ATPase [Candidatus Andersenbacteria bacterium CG10_big_fil_rev_8_21_14_0_10_54_11]
MRTGTIQDTRPLAAQLRPKRLDDFVGQEAVVGPGTALRRAIERGNVGSLILWGPPGVGKTSLAYIIAERMQADVERVSAVASGVKDLRDVIGRAILRQAQSRRTVLIVDEIHRFNKAQQDVLLPAVEEGVVTLIGATTENPYFEVVAALVSRAPVVRLEPLRDEAVGVIINRAAGKVQVRAEARMMIIRMAGGDARRALTLLERVVQTAGEGEITEVDVAAAAQQQIVQYDKAGDAHYDTISAFIKSLRGSDPDAALFYLFRMLAAGEDPNFIVRRMFIFASEDIGNADPHALMLVSAGGHALEWVGLPEAEYALAHAVVYLAAAPKSNAVMVAMVRAKKDVLRHGNARPPGHITNSPIAAMKKHGTGVGYKYPHDFPGQLVKQNYRPDVIQGNIYYEPGTEGFEKEVQRRVEAARRVMRDE